MYENRIECEETRDGLFAETAFSAEQVAEARLAEVAQGVTDEPCAFVGRLGNVDPGQR